MDAMPIKTEAMTQRIGRFYTGQPSWRTRLRDLRRRLGDASLPLSEEEWLIEVAHELKEQRRQPVRALRIAYPLPRVLLAHDGTTSFRFFHVPRNASTNITYWLLELTGEGAYRSWSETAHWNTQADSALGDSVRGKVHSFGPHRVFVTLNEQRVHIYDYMTREFFAPEPHADMRFCVVRDPMERFLSGIAQFQIAFFGKTQKLPAIHDAVIDAWLDAMLLVYAEGAPIRGMPREALMRRMDACYARAAPDLGDAWRRIWFRQVEFLGHDAQYYTHIFSLRQSEELHAFLSKLAGRPLSNFRANSARSWQKEMAARGLSLARPQLTPAQRRKIETIYAEDYRVFGRWF